MKSKQPKTQVKKKTEQQKKTRSRSFNSENSSDLEYSSDSKNLDKSTPKISNEHLLKVSFSPDVQFKPPRKPENRWINSLSDEQKRILSRNQKLVDRYKQTVLMRYGLPGNASNKLISQSCIPRKVLIMINQASKDVEILFRKSTLYTELENLISSDIQEKNAKLSDQYIEKFIDKYGSVENIPDGEYLKAFQAVSSWKDNDENLLPDCETESLITILNSL